MPFTPFHMGPGMLMKALLQGSFSLVVFGWTQIVMDIQPLIVLLSGAGHLHGFTHTFMGATLIAAACALSGKYLADHVLRRLQPGVAPSVSWTVATASAFIGSYSHVLLDAIMHADLAPFSPFSISNPFLGYLSMTALHEICLYTGLLGIALYLSTIAWKKKHGHRE